MFIFLIIGLFAGCRAKMVYNQTIFDEKSNSDILYGYANLNGFKAEPYNTWYQFEYSTYQPDLMALDQVPKEALNEISVTIVMATWCSDSQREVPRFVKIMDSEGYDPSNITIINVDRKKMAKNTPVEKLKIERIPTFIFSKNGKEIGRIVESPKESLEKDMVSIIGG